MVVSALEPCAVLRPIVEGEQRAVWKFARLWMAIATSVVLVAGLWRLISGTLGTLFDKGFDSDAVTWLIIWLFFVVLSVGQCVWWRATILSTQYWIDGGRLIAMQRGREVVSVSVAQVAGAEIVGSMNWAELVTAFRWGTAWPSARLVVRSDDGSDEVVWLPEVMLWGLKSALSAEVALRRALNLHVPPDFGTQR